MVLPNSDSPPPARLMGEGKWLGDDTSDAMLPGFPPKGDLWEWIEAGGNRERLDEIVAKT